jgi:hypothetical protein
VDSTGKTYLSLAQLLRLAEIARLLEAIELRLYLRVGSRRLQESILSNGSRTGILEGWSYDPREALRAVQGTRRLHGAPLLSQVVHFDRLVYLGCSV